MRIEKFIAYLKELNADKAIYLLSNPVVNGGLEVWFQVELAIQTKCLMHNYVITREVTYPDDSQRCDLYCFNQGQPEEAYIELKCMNPFHAERCEGEFIHDIEKVRRLEKKILTAVAKNKTIITVLCMLIYYGDVFSLKERLNVNLQNKYSDNIKEYQSIKSKIKTVQLFPGENLFLIYYGETYYFRGGI